MTDTTMDDATATSVISDTTTPAQENGKDTPQTGPSSDDNEKLKAREQFEFYFHDSNLPYDRFMWQLHTANPEHWIPISTISSFKRMRDFSSHGIDWLVDALRASEVLEIDESGTKCRRIHEVKERNAFDCSVYAKGFGDEHPTLQQEIEEFFRKYGATNAVRMRRDQDKSFKGSVFVEFRDIESVEAFLKADPKPSWNGQELVIMSKNDYCEMKIQEKGLTGKAADFRRSSASVTGRHFNAFAEMRKTSGGDKKAANGNKKEKPTLFLNIFNKNIQVHEDADGKAYVKDEDIPHLVGASLRFDGCAGDVDNKEVYRVVKDTIKSKFQKAPFVTRESGAEFGLVSFDKPLSEDEIQFIKENIKSIDGKELSWSALDEEAERRLHVDRANVLARSLVNSRNGTSDNRGNKGRRGGRGGHGGHGGHGGGRGNNNGRAKGHSNALETAAASEEAATGQPSRKRQTEPSSVLAGVRGVGVPSISATKKPVVIPAHGAPKEDQENSAGEKRKREDGIGHEAITDDTAGAKKVKTDVEASA